MTIRGLMILVTFGLASMSLGCTSVRINDGQCGPLGCGEPMILSAGVTSSCTGCESGCDECAVGCSDGCTSCSSGGLFKNCGQNFDVCLPRISICDLPYRIYNSITCKAGCGDEVYLGEWLSDPPKCDPCDCQGNWIGHDPTRICRPGILGVRYGKPACGGCGTCDQCASCGSDTTMMELGTVPTPAAIESNTYYKEPPAWNGGADVAEINEEQLEVDMTVPTSIHSTNRKPYKLGRGSL